MKARGESEQGWRVGIWCLVIAGGLTGAWIGYAADESSAAPTSGVSINSQQSSRSQPVRLSPGLAEVLRLVKSHMDDQVIKAYIFATLINGNPVYSGYYVAGYGYVW